MERLTGKYFMDGETMLGVDAFHQFPEGFNLFYEVIRVLDGKPLFIREHYLRFQESVVRAEGGFSLDFVGFRWAIMKLIQMNQKTIGNIKIVYWHQDPEDHYLYYFIPHAYPNQQDYDQGVRVGVLEAERKNPQIKMIQPLIREQANQLLQENPWYEVLLVNHFGEITEGSRSNVFFIQNNQIVTPPINDVLPGITRQKVIKCISELGYSCREQAVKLRDLASFEAAFLTGTSPKVLPIAQIGNHQFKTLSPIFKAIAGRYEEKIQQDLQNIQTVVL